VGLQWLIPLMYLAGCGCCLQNHGVGPVTFRRRLGIDQLPVKRWGHRSISGGKRIVAHSKKFTSSQPSNP
jgi:hypothetical protein